MLFFRCNHCGNFIVFLGKKAAPIICCGEPMVEVKANTTDAATEKHVPVVSVEGNVVTVKVGNVDHSMLDEHFIQFVILETSQGFQKKELHLGDAPCVTFALADSEKPVAAYEYCNLPGLWKAEC